MLLNFPSQVEGYCSENELINCPPVTSMTELMCKADRRSTTTTPYVYKYRGGEKMYYVKVMSASTDMRYAESNG